MPTPTQAFVAVAARHGIDPSDPEAVQRWFLEVLPDLPTEQIEEILEELVSYYATGDIRSEARSYPEGVPLPMLDESPPAPTPLLAARWREMLRILLVRLLRGRGK